MDNPRSRAPLWLKRILVLGFQGCIFCNHLCYPHSAPGTLARWARLVNNLGECHTESLHRLRALMLFPRFVSFSTHSAKYKSIYWINYGISVFQYNATSPFVVLMDHSWSCCYIANSTGSQPWRPGESVYEEGANFPKLVLGCTEADFCNNKNL